MSLYPPGWEVGGGFNIFKTRVKFNQDSQQHRKSQVRCSITTGGGGVLDTYRSRISKIIHTPHAFHIFNDSGHPTIVNLSEAKSRMYQGVFEVMIRVSWIRLSFKLFTIQPKRSYFAGIELLLQS